MRVRDKTRTKTIQLLTSKRSQARKGPLQIHHPSVHVVRKTAGGEGCPLSARGALPYPLAVREVELGVQGVRVVLGDSPRELVVLDRHTVPNKLWAGVDW